MRKKSALDRQPCWGSSLQFFEGRDHVWIYSFGFFFFSPGAFFRYIGIGVGGPVAGWLGG